MKALRDPPPGPVQIRRTTLGNLIRNAMNIWYEQLVTVIVPRHAILYNEKTKIGYPIWQRCWVDRPGYKLGVGVVYATAESASQTDEPDTMILYAEDSRPSTLCRNEDWILATEDLTPPKDSLQHLAALVIAKHWSKYSEDDKEEIWERTLLTKKWKDMLAVK